MSLCWMSWRHPDTLWKVVSFSRTCLQLRKDLRAAKDQVGKLFMTSMFKIARTVHSQNYIDSIDIRSYQIEACFEHIIYIDITYREQEWDKVPAWLHYIMCLIYFQSYHKYIILWSLQAGFNPTALWMFVLVLQCSKFKGQFTLIIILIPSTSVLIKLKFFEHIIYIEIIKHI